MRKQSYVVVPNHIITDSMMYPTTKRLLVAILAYSSRHGTVRKSLEELASLSGCSSTTVQQALDELQDRGIIHKIRCFRYSQYLSRPVYAKNAYQIKRSKLQGTYTLVPRELLASDISHATFVVALYIYKTSGRKGRSCPSLRTAAKQTDLSKATICRALKALRLTQLLARYFCITANRVHSCNSYYPTAWVRPSRPNSAYIGHLHLFLDRGGLNFIEHQAINKISLGLYLEGKEIGVDELVGIAQKI